MDVLKKIRIVTDSTVDMKTEELEKLNIEIVPLTISIDGETYTDRVEITPSEFMRKMKDSEELPKTSEPARGAFLEMYDRRGSEGYDVLSIHLTGAMSGTVQSAQSAANMTETNVTVVDSRFITKGLSFQVIEAAKMAKEGKSLQEIIDRLSEIRQHTRLYIVVDSFENLVRGGELEGTAFPGSLLHIKPIASLEKGIYTGREKKKPCPSS